MHQQCCASPHANSRGSMCDVTRHGKELRVTDANIPNASLVHVWCTFGARSCRTWTDARWWTLITSIDRVCPSGFIARPVMHVDARSGNLHRVHQSEGRRSRRRVIREKPAHGHVPQDSPPRSPSNWHAIQEMDDTIRV